MSALPPWSGSHEDGEGEEEVSMTAVTGTSSAFDAIELDAALRVVAGHAAGPLGAAHVLARRPSTDAGAIAGELATVDEVAHWLRRGGAGGIEPVSDIGPILARLAITGSVLEAADLAALAATLAAIRQTHDALRRLAEEAPRSAALLTDLPPRTLERELRAAIDDDGNVRDEASPGLGQLRRRIRETRQRLVATLERILRDQEPGDAQRTVTVRNGRYVIPIRRDATARIRGIVHAESASGGTIFVEPTEVVEAGNALRALEGDEAREIQRVLRELTARLRPEAATIAAAWRMAIAADDLLARARYAVAVDGHCPTIIPAPAPPAPLGTALAIRRGRHPLLAQPVAFDLTLLAGERTLLISGPNAGGKTVLMKAVGLIAALAQAGIIPPVGPDTRLPVFAGFFADIGDRQSIAASLSTFSAHVETLGDLLARADARSLVMLDEIGAGTDPAEGAALAAAVLLALTGRGALTLATTHLGQLKRLADEDGAVVNASLEFDTATLRPTYRLSQGLPGRSFGLAIARRLGLPDEVLRQAEAAVPAGERELDVLLADVERRAAALAVREAELSELETSLGRREARLAERARELSAAAAKIEAAEREVAREARTAARRYLLDARKKVEEALALARQAVDEATAREARRLIEQAVQSDEPGAAGLTPFPPLRSAVGEPGGDAAALPGTGGATSTLPVRGDRVRTPVGGVGVVTEVRADGRAVVEAGGMRMVVALGALERLEPAERLRPVIHYDELPAATSVNLRGLRADEAEAAFVRAVDEAVRADLAELAVIHGKGTGALRALVQALSEADPRVSASGPAPPEQGGSGVTLIRLRR